MTKTTATTAKKADRTPVGTRAGTALKSAAKPAARAAVTKPAASPVDAGRPVPRSTARTAPATRSAEAQPSLRFFHSSALRVKTHAVLVALEDAPDQPGHGDALASLVTELIEAGMDYYFIRALKQAQVGFVAEQSARIGMSGAVKLISSVNRKFIVRMDSSQLLVVAQHIRALC